MALKRTKFNKKEKYIITNGFATLKCIAINPNNKELIELGLRPNTIKDAENNSIEVDKDYYITRTHLECINPDEKYNKESNPWQTDVEGKKVDYENEFKTFEFEFYFRHDLNKLSKEVTEEMIKDDVEAIKNKTYRISLYVDDVVAMSRVTDKIMFIDDTNQREWAIAKEELTGSKGLNVDTAKPGIGCNTNFAAKSVFGNSNSLNINENLFNIFMSVLFNVPENKTMCDGFIMGEEDWKLARKGNVKAIQEELKESSNVKGFEGIFALLYYTASEKDGRIFQNTYIKHMFMRNVGADIRSISNHITKEHYKKDYADKFPGDINNIPEKIEKANPTVWLPSIKENEKGSTNETPNIGNYDDDDEY